jgi:hypothetical protein
MLWQSDVRPSCPPRLVHRPPGAVGSFGPEATELAAEAGLILDDWQAWYLDNVLAYDCRGRWVTFENGLTVPRQNGKGGIIEARMLAGLFLLEEVLITYTAHEFKTAQEHYLRITNLVENTPRLHKQVARYRKASGAEAIELRDGRRLRFLARSAGSGRGFSGDVVFFDEGMINSPATVGALLPTMSARTHVTAGGPQLYHTGTAGKGEPAAVLAGVRDRAIAGSDPGLFYAEWAAGKADDHTGENVDLDDLAAWLEANPAMHGAARINAEFIERERAAMDADEFSRERLGLWGVGAGGAVIDADVWAALLDADSRIKGKTAFAVDIPPEGKRASIGRAGERPDGKVHVEVDTRQGTTWAVERLAELSKKRNAVVVLDGGSRAVSLVPALVGAGVEPIIYTTRDIVSACGAFVDKVDEGGLRHMGQPELNLAVSGARRRKVGDAWAWHRRDTATDIGPLVVSTLAAYALKEEPPRRKTGRSMAV